MFDSQLLGARILSLRTARGWSQAEVVAKLFAMKVEISPKYLERIEKGERAPAPDIIAGLCDIFDVSGDYLLLRSNNPDGNDHRI